MRGGHKTKDETHKRFFYYFKGCLVLRFEIRDFFYYFKGCLVLRFEAIVADTPIIIIHTDIDIKI
jgi:hypothetical protein